jgi:hypothetical protein
MTAEVEVTSDPSPYRETVFLTIRLNPLPRGVRGERESDHVPARNTMRTRESHTMFLPGTPCVPGSPTPCSCPEHHAYPGVPHHVPGRNTRAYPESHPMFPLGTRARSRRSNPCPRLEHRKLPGVPHHNPAWNTRAYPEAHTMFLPETPFVTEEALALSSPERPG